jgi:cytochrome P450
MTACPVPPGPHPLRLVGQLLLAGGDPLGPLLRLGKEYPELAAVRVGERLHVAGFGPRVHRAVLVDREAAFARYHRPSSKRLYPQDLERLDGEPHRLVRRQLAPLYARSRLDDIADGLREMIERDCETWPPGAPVDLAERLKQLVPRLLVRAIAGVDPGDEIYSIIRQVRRRTSTPLAFIRESCPADLPWSAYRHRRAYVRQLEQFIGAAVEAAPTGTIEPLTDQVRIHATVSVPGGAGVTAAAATWAFYLLARHPAALGHLVTELGSPGDGRAPTTPEILALPWLDQIVKESLRLYANVVVLPRVAVDTVQIDGYSIPRGSYVALFPFVLHRRPELFARSRSFVPERFAADPIEPPPFAYLPFGAGPHNCLGQGLAVIILKLLLGTVLRQFSLELEPRASLARRSILTQEIELRLPVRLYSRAAARRLTSASCP